MTSLENLTLQEGAEPGSSGPVTRRGYKSNLYHCQGKRH